MIRLSARRRRRPIADSGRPPPTLAAQAGSARAAELGISRSEFFARAARRYLDELAAQSITRQIDQALLAAGDDSGAAATAAGCGLLGAGGNDW